jgi:phosphoglycerate kinase
MDTSSLDPKLPLIQDADLQDKVVLVRVDHNVVKKGVIKDPYRIDRTMGTLYHIVERGGRPILMTHIGRPRDKKTGNIKISEQDGVGPIVDYLEHKLHVNFHVPQFNVDGDAGIGAIETSINLDIKRLRRHDISGIYLPNTRWFAGEEVKDERRDRLARQLAGLADVFVNDAFGSWQPHASTYDVTRYLPSFAGFLMQEEILSLGKVLSPQKPFLAVVAGAKFDTKIEPLKALFPQVDYLILGGVMYNAYLAAKYDVSIAGVSEDDMSAARDLVAMDQKEGKIVELPLIVESDTLEGRKDGQYRTINVRELKAGQKLNYILDVDAASFDDAAVRDKILGAKTIFVNAVMGFTPHFTAGSRTLDEIIDRNDGAQKMYGGGDTLQEFKDLCPGLFLSVMHDADYYFFTGGGTVLKALQEHSPYGLPPVVALMDNGGKSPEGNGQEV